MWAPFHTNFDRYQSIFVGSNGDGRLEVFGIDSQRRVFRCRQTIPGGIFGGWQMLNNADDLLSMLATCLDAAGRLHAFGIAPDDTILHAQQGALGGDWGPWSEFHGLGDRLRSLTAFGDQSSRIHVFGIAADETIWHTWQPTANGNWNAWTPFHSANDRLVTIAVARDLAGLLHAFGTAGDYTIWHTAESTPDVWTPWQPFHSSTDRLRTLSVELGRSGFLHAFGTSEDGAAMHTAQNPATGRWTPWTAIAAAGERLSFLRGQSDSEGRLHLFGLGVNSIWQTWETAPGRFGPWLRVYDVSDRVSMFASANDNWSRMHLFRVDGSERIWHAVPWNHVIRVLAVPMRDHPSEQPPDARATVTPLEFAQAVERANQCFEGTGIRLVFDFESDWEPLTDTVINRDGPGMLARGNAFAATRPGKIVCFLRFGPDRTPTGNGNAYPPSGLGPIPADVPTHEQNYVALPNLAPDGNFIDLGRGSFLAHEFGHYLGLHHTFVGWSDLFSPVYRGVRPATQAAADQAVVDYIMANGGTIAALDGDGIADTPPDPSPVLYRARGLPNNGGDICAMPTITINGTFNGAAVSFTFTPNPNNVMSYYSGCPPVGPGHPRTPHVFSPLQVVRMHQALRHPTRRHLLYPPLR